MKPCRFNYFVEHKGRHVVFNGLTKRFFFVSEKNHLEFERIISAPNDEASQKKYVSFLDRMRLEGFVLDDDVDERKLLEEELARQRFPDQYMLMVLPTYQCNLRCWYCIQKHQSVSLSAETAMRIKRHISIYLVENSIKKFRLSWFGGEPLLGYEILSDITKFSQEFCKQHGIEFYCDITTNGLLLTGHRIIELGDMGVRGFQITIDGCRVKHNQVKKSVDGMAFDKAVSNVLGIVKNIPGVNCTLRINYSEDTLEPGRIMHDLNALIPPEYRSSIKISPCKIWQVDEDAIPDEKVDELHRLARHKKYRPNGPGCSLCYVDYSHFNCVFPNGTVDKCENEELTKTRGMLTETGRIEWQELNAFELHQSLSPDSECNDCRHLPFCMGPCPARRNEMYEENGRIVCQYSDRERSIRKLILRYCEDNCEVNV